MDLTPRKLKCLRIDEKSIVMSIANAFTARAQH
jgi:hypothetical protein